MAVDSDPTSHHPTVLDGARVLVVDDDPTVRALLVRWLQRVHLDATEARDGVEAMQLLENGETYDVILVDRQMPRVGGLDLLRWLRGRPAVARTKAVLMTGNAFDRGAAMQAGADEFLPKPFGMSEVLGLLAAMGIAAGVGE